MYFVALAVYLICLLVAVSAGAAAAFSDFRGMKIPNACSATVVASFAVAFVIVKLSGFDVVFTSFASHFLGGVVMFGATYTLFSFGVLGGGDSKLITAYGFWAGLHSLPVFIFYVTIAGSVLALLAMAVMRMPVLNDMPEGSWLARVRARERVVPYGIAIFLGAFVTFYVRGYFSVFFSS